MSPEKSKTATIGENLAAKYLQKKGYTILHRNWRYSRIGEIDIIAQLKNEISFVEVKTRTSTCCGDPLESISITKQRKIIRLAEIFIANNSMLDGCSFSFDAISILLKPAGMPEINHLINAFTT